MDNNNGNGGGIGFCSLLTIVFIVLKLVGVINWSWIWVLAPTWVPLATVIMLIIGAKVVLSISQYKIEHYNDIKTDDDYKG